MSEKVDTTSKDDNVSKSNEENDKKPAAANSASAVSNAPRKKAIKVITELGPRDVLLGRYVCVNCVVMVY